MNKLSDLEKLLLIALVTAILVPFFVYFRWQAQYDEPPEVYQEELIYQFKAGDDVVPDYYQLWKINGEEHLIVLPR